jgi:4-amino-4-deoxy-L-arabinose transferase-like glycosyltransferase
VERVNFVTSVEFFVLSRAVILDMVLTFFIYSLAYLLLVSRLAAGRRRKFLLLSMYVSIGAATVVKGPIGLVLPAAVIFFNLLLSRKWALLDEMELCWEYLR